MQIIKVESKTQFANWFDSNFQYQLSLFVRTNAYDAWIHRTLSIYANTKNALQRMQCIECNPENEMQWTKHN